MKARTGQREFSVASGDNDAAIPPACTLCGVRSLTVCAPLDNAGLTAVDEIATRHTFEPGQTIFDEGEPSQHLFNVTDGTVKIYKLLADGRRQITGFLFSGDFLGLASEATYTYSAEAVTTTKLCCFRHGQLDELLQRSPQMERRLLAIAGHELAEAQEQMLLLGRKTAKERVASFLLLLSRRAKQTGRSEDPVHVPMNRTDIADYLGLTTETVSRTFTKLKLEGLIRLLPKSMVALADRQQLSDIAETS
ncbi:MAG: cyclic nucleotide-binding domain-containing protein [Rhodospirillales bacterium]|nr:cyclic nucleotide-binding domain-containing protein [Rhodospirillales bacterium]